MSRTDDGHEVVVVTGAGGMGEAVARRLGNGRKLLIADHSEEQLDRVADALQAAGYDVGAVPTDVSDRSSVDALARTAAESGRIVSIVHTAGVSPATSTARRILEVDLLGTAHVIDAFAPVASRGTSLVCVSSMAGHYASLSRDDERELATAATEELLGLKALSQVGEDATAAYIVSKRANHVRVQTAAPAWNRRGARVNTVSPGVIATPMSKSEGESASGDHMREMLRACGIDRKGTPGEIAEAVAFLAGPDSRYVTGTDLLVDGGQAAWIRWHRPAD
ncbi:SDR family oxidoreductase [Nocardiopsis dassonvillei]|uniref:SDR family oxidoreductase n=1 Tax=Nocardiopsis dassonvillei TaxID=2014 RepID=UPI0020A5EC5F|nr:SDR family oxidoreductase [Nocardiopsis dassonvillei]MCP3012253.1 SDR family oxidoreductase [Nocardiopsis dassonvillei]